MRLRTLSLVLALGTAVFLLSGGAAPGDTTPAVPPWAMNASIIEACSCPMFCQCYFNAEPAASGDHNHYCRFNNAFHVNKGNYGKTDLAGAKFWVAGDLGGDFSKGQMDWAVLTFDPSVTKEQREGIVTVLGKLYPVKWSAFSVAKDSPMTWSLSKDAGTAA
jgi:hypothetical protein